MTFQANTEPAESEAPMNTQEPTELPEIVLALAQPLPGGITVRSMKVFPGTRTYGFTGKVVKGKQTLAEVRNEGDGGATRLTKLNPTPAVWAQFEKEVKAWFVMSDSLYLVNYGQPKPIYSATTDLHTMLTCWAECFVDLAATEKEFSAKRGQKFLVRLESFDGKESEWFGIPAETSPENLPQMVEKVRLFRAYGHKARAIYIGKKSPWSIREWTLAVAKAFEGV